MIRTRFVGLRTGARSVTVKAPQGTHAMDWESVERRLADITCPLCKNSTEYTVPRDSRVTDGDYKAFCKGCRYSFPIHMDVESFTRSQPDVAYWLKGMRSVRAAIYFVTCTACRRPFFEQSSLEAFE